MGYIRSQMLYDNGSYYKWSSRADPADPYYIRGTDHSELSRTEGFEVLYFINHIGKKHWPQNPTHTDYQKMERMIRHAVPSSVKTHKKIADWILENWSVC